MRGAFRFALALWAEEHRLNGRAQQTVAETTSQSTEQRDDGQISQRFAQSLRAPENQAERECTQGRGCRAE